MASSRPYKLSDRGIRPSEVNRNYLHTNSTSHTWPFSAFAELIDNAYDPDVNAKQIWIDKTVIGGEQCLMFRDNGKGMCPDKLHKMLSFGFCEKQKVDNHVPIGMYGNGFKSGSMRLGRDALVFTKNGTHMSVGMLSQSYLEAINQETIIVPIAEWNQRDRKLERGDVSLCDILQYSLFKTEEQLLTELSAIQTRTGTKIIIWNLRRNRGKSLELDFESDKYDILIPHDLVEEQLGSKLKQNYGERQRQMPDSEYSLRAYCSILYLKPRTQVILRGAKVKTQLIAKSLAHIDHDIYQPHFLPLGKQKVKITFGFNCKSRVHYGIMMYHHNRLIKAYERTKCQLQVGGVGEGVIGIIECDFLKPTHNKQDFDQTNEYRLTQSAVDRKLQDFWRDRSDLKLGLVDSTFNSKDLIAKPDQIWAQCDGCLKWRKLPDDIGKLPDKWYCQLNPDPQYRNCEIPEEPEDTDEVDVYMRNIRRRELREKAEQQMLKAKMEQEVLRHKGQLKAKQASEVVTPLVIRTVTDNGGKTSAAVLRAGALPALPTGATVPVASPAAKSVQSLGSAAAGGTETVQNLMNRVVQEAAFLKREKENLLRLSRQAIEADSTAVAEMSRIAGQCNKPSCSSTASPSTSSSSSSSSSSACQGLRISDVKSLSVNGAWQQMSLCTNGAGGEASRGKRTFEASGTDQAKRLRLEPAGSSAAGTNHVTSAGAGAASSSTYTIDDDDVICLDAVSPAAPRNNVNLRKVKQEAAAPDGAPEAPARGGATVLSHGVQTVTLPFRCKTEEDGGGGGGEDGTAAGTGTARATVGAVSADTSAVDGLRRENERLQKEVQELQQQLLSRTVVKDEREEEEKKKMKKQQEKESLAGGPARSSSTAPSDSEALRKELTKLKEDAIYQAKEWETVVNHLMKEVEESVVGHKQATAENQRLSEECDGLRAAAAAGGHATETAEASTGTEDDAAAGVDACVGPDTAAEASETVATEDGKKLQRELEKTGAELEKTGAELERLQKQNLQLEAQEAKTAIYLSQGMTDKENLAKLRQNVAQLLQNLIPEFHIPDDASLVDDLVPQLLKSTSS